MKLMWFAGDGGSSQPVDNPRAPQPASSGPDHGAIYSIPETVQPASLTRCVGGLCWSITERANLIPDHWWQEQGQGSKASPVESSTGPTT